MAAGMAADVLIWSKRMNAKRPKDVVEETATDEQGPPQAGGNGDATGVEQDAGDSPEQALEAVQARADENWERYVRAAAELDNVRKRAARDVENAHKFALERFGKELLAVRDTLEMGLAAAEGASIESLIEGKEATLKLLTTVLQQFGIEEVDPAGEPFDPELHEAISMQPSDSAEPGSVLTVVQKGYTLNGRLLRPAMVIVASEA